MLSGATDGKSMFPEKEDSDDGEQEKAQIKKWRKSTTPSREDLAKLSEFLKPDKNEV